jgi:hypothetical protein
MKIYKGLGNLKGLIAKTDDKNVFFIDTHEKEYSWIESSMTCEYLNFCIKNRWYEQITEEEAFELIL